MKKLFKIFKKKSSNKTLYYSFKRISLYNWEMCMSGDVRYCRRGYEETEHVDPITEEDALKWIEIQDLYIQRFKSDSKDIQVILKLKIRVANLKLRYLQEPIKNRHLINDIMQLEEQLRLKIKSGAEHNITFDELKVIVGKDYKVDENMTAYSFFCIVEFLNKKDV